MELHCNCKGTRLIVCFTLKIDFKVYMLCKYNMLLCSKLSAKRRTVGCKNGPNLLSSICQQKSFLVIQINYQFKDLLNTVLERLFLIKRGITLFPIFCLQPCLRGKYTLQKIDTGTCCKMIFATLVLIFKMHCVCNH